MDLSRGLTLAILAGVLVLATVARLAVMVPSWREPPVDPDRYLDLARSLAQDRSFAVDGRPTAFRPPLYPLVLAPLAAAGWVGDPRAIFTLHLVLGWGTVALTVLTASRWGLPAGRMGLAGAIVALDPVLVAQSRLVMTETLAAFLVAATLAALAGPRPWLSGGLGLGLLSLCRPSFLPCAGLIVLGAGLEGPGPVGTRPRRMLALGMMALVVIAPWACRNFVVFGQPLWGTTHGGYTLALANNPVYYAEVVEGPPGAVWGGPGQAAWWREIARETSGLNEIEADRRLQESALRLVRSQPGTFLKASLARLRRFWAPAPSAAVYDRKIRLLTAAWTIPLWLLLLAGLSHRSAWTWPLVATVLFPLGLTLVHSVYWSDMRMRAPVVPAIALLAALGIMPRGWRSRPPASPTVPGASGFATPRERDGGEISPLDFVAKDQIPRERPLV